VWYITQLQRLCVDGIQSPPKPNRDEEEQLSQNNSISQSIISVALVCSEVLLLELLIRLRVGAKTGVLVR
jgi:hypothetical protein